MIQRQVFFQNLLSVPLLQALAKMQSFFDILVTSLSVSFHQYTVQCTVYSVACFYRVQCVVYTLHCTVYSVQCSEVGDGSPNPVDGQVTNAQHHSIASGFETFSHNKNVL